MTRWSHQLFLMLRRYTNPCAAFEQTNWMRTGIAISVPIGGRTTLVMAKRAVKEVFLNFLARKQKPADDAGRPGGACELVSRCRATRHRRTSGRRARKRATSSTPGRVLQTTYGRGDRARSFRRAPRRARREPEMLGLPRPRPRVRLNAT